MKPARFDGIVTRARLPETRRVHVRIHKSLAIGRLRRAIVAILVAMAVVAATAASVDAQWPTGCVELNDIVELHLGNTGNVGIYQQVFRNQAEAACRADHRTDVQTTFAWAFGTSPAATAETPTTTTAQPDEGWPTTCVNLNDVVEAWLGNNHNVGIYARTFGDQAEARCQHDHADDVRQTFTWAGPCEAATVARAGRTGHIRAFDAPGPTVGDLAASNRQLERLLFVMPWLGCFTYPWLIDGISDPDQMALNGLLLTDSINRDLAMFVAAADWFADGTNSVDPYSGEMYALGYIQQIAQKSHELGNLIGSFAWIADDMTYDETIALRSLNYIAEQDLQFTLDMASAPWVKDGLTPYEKGALGSLGSVFLSSPDLARQLLANTMRAPIWATDLRVITALGEIATHTDAEGNRTDRYQRLVNTPWFKDGLDARERALINALSIVHVYQEKLFYRLLKHQHTRSLEFTLPLTGRFRLWAFDDEPIPEGLHILSTVAQGLRGAERIVHSPLPFNDIVVLMNGAVSVRQNGLIGIQSGRTGEIYQMVSRLYFSEDAGPNYPYYEHPSPRSRLFSPKWLAYSAPEFINAFTNDWQGSRSLADQNHEWDTEVRSKCADRGYTSIHALSMQTRPALYSRGETLRHCADLYGRMLLYRLFTTLGEERMSFAMRDLHVLAERDGGRKNAEGILTPSEKDIYRTFLRHTPPHLYDEVRHWYNHLHGGPFIAAVN